MTRETWGALNTRQWRERQEYLQSAANDGQTGAETARLIGVGWNRMDQLRRQYHIKIPAFRKRNDQETLARRKKLLASGKTSIEVMEAEGLKKVVAFRLYCVRNKLPWVE